MTTAATTATGNDYQDRDGNERDDDLDQNDGDENQAALEPQPELERPQPVDRQPRQHDGERQRDRQRQNDRQRQPRPESGPERKRAPTWRRSRVIDGSGPQPVIEGTPVEVALGRRSADRPRPTRRRAAPRPRRQPRRGDASGDEAAASGRNRWRAERRRAGAHRGCRRVSQTASKRASRLAWPPDKTESRLQQVAAGGFLLISVLRPQFAMPIDPDFANKGPATSGSLECRLIRCLSVSKQPQIAAEEEAVERSRRDEADVTAVRDTPSKTTRRGPDSIRPGSLAQPL